MVLKLSWEFKSIFRAKAKTTTEWLNTITWFILNAFIDKNLPEIMNVLGDRFINHQFSITGEFNKTLQITLLGQEIMLSLTDKSTNSLGDFYFCACFLELKYYTGEKGGI